jgi:multiple sugar transport system substrate-binding protein
VGAAARGACLLPLDEHLPAAYLRAQSAQSVGRSHESYQFDGHQWALAIDAAAQVGVYRPDLLERRGQALPQTWDDVIALALAASGPKLALPLTPANAVCSFLSLCAIHGDLPGTDPARLVGREAGLQALAILRELIARGHPASLDLDPPSMLHLMTHTDEIMYCPLLFGYSNYSRPGFAPYACRFADIPTPKPGAPPEGAILGGTGLAISSSCQAVEIACDHASWIASAECQRTLYVESGGQPGNRMAWLDAHANDVSGNFFVDTLGTLDRSYLRPRHDGFVHFQERAGLLLHQSLRDGGLDGGLLDRLDALFRASFRSRAEAL